MWVFVAFLFWGNSGNLSTKIKNLFLKGSSDASAIAAGQKVLMHRATSNKLASLGKYEGEEKSGAAAESLFVANHSY